VDRRDYQSLASLYHEQSYDDHGAMFQGTGEAFVKWLPDMLANMQVTSHIVSNHLITVDSDNGYAEGEVVCQAYHLTSDDQEVLIGGRYLDKYIFDQGRWWFKARKIVLDFNRISDKPLCDFNSPFAQGVERGAAINDDPSSTFFTLLNTEG
jgi:hypothetical protein